MTLSEVAESYRQFNEWHAESLRTFDQEHREELVDRMESLASALRRASGDQS